MPRKPTATRVILEALSIDDAIVITNVEVHVRRAQISDMRGNLDDYENQLRSIRDLIHKSLPATERRTL